MDDNGNGPHLNGNLQIVLSQLLTSNQAIQSDVAGMKEQLVRVAVHLERVDTRNEAADRLHSDHESRLRILERLDITAFEKLSDRVSSLERWRYMMGGALVVLEVASTLALYLLLHRP